MKGYWLLLRYLTILQVLFLVSRIRAYWTKRGMSQYQINRFTCVRVVLSELSMMRSVSINCLSFVSMLICTVMYNQNKKNLNSAGACLNGRVGFLHLHKIVEGLYFHFSLSVCLCVRVSVCPCVCVSVCPAFLVNKILAERMHRFGRGFR